MHKFVKPLAMIGIMAALLLPAMVMMPGCGTTPNRVTYEAAGTARVGIQEALKFWNDQYVKPGKATITQEQAVRAAYNKAQASAFLLCDAGIALSAAGGQTNAVPFVMQALETAAANFAQDKADLISLLTQFGVKLP